MTHWPWALLFASSTVAAGILPGGETNPAEPPSYEDRLLENSANFDPADKDVVAIPYDPQGWVRGLKIEARLGTDPLRPGPLAAGVRINGLIETPNWGVLSVDADMAGQQSQHSLTLRQRALPLAGGWMLNNEAGVIAPAVPSLTQVPSRVYVPNSLVEGVSTEWKNSGKAVQMQASTGYLGRLDGLVSPGYQRSTGEMTSVGGQADGLPIKTAVRWVKTRGLEQADLSLAGSSRINADSGLVVMQSEHAGYRVQANALSSQASHLNGQRLGVWMDAAKELAQGSQSLGYYRLDHQLTMAGQPIASDVTGAYGRINRRTRKWSFDGSADWLRGMSDPSKAGTYLTSVFRWQESRHLGFSVGGAVRHFNGDAWNVFGDARWKSGLVNTGLRASSSRELDQSHSEALTLDNDWLGDTSESLSTSLTVGRDTNAVQSHARWGAAVSTARSIGSTVYLRGNLMTDRSRVGSARTSATLGIFWQVAQRWSWDVNLSTTRGSTRAYASIDPLAPPTFASPMQTSNHSVLAVLRYAYDAGSRQVPLGGRALDGGGRIEGIVFQDANRNESQEASEAGLAGVTVFMDGRYATRTDSQGHFVFPFVASGRHLITVQNETLPLPWVSPTSSGSAVELSVRESRNLRIGVVRQSGD